MDTVEVKQVIITTIKRNGKGIDNDPIRVVTQVWDMKGDLLFEVDPLQETLLVEQVARFENKFRKAFDDMKNYQSACNKLDDEIDALKKENESLQKEIERLQPKEINPLEHENMK